MNQEFPETIPQTFLEHAELMFVSDHKLAMYILESRKFTTYLNNTEADEDIDDLTKDARVWWALLHYAMEERE